MKYIPINGLKITNSSALHWFGVNNRSIVEFDFFAKKDFENLQINLCNYSKDDKFDSIVRFDSQCHNSYEEQAIKSLISLLHIVSRIIKYYVDNKIETINEVKEIVTNNMKQDKSENAFKYITINSNDEEVRLASDYLIFYGD